MLPFCHFVTNTKTYELVSELVNITCKNTQDRQKNDFFGCWGFGLNCISRAQLAGIVEYLISKK